ncbi:ABC transporter ATP-binding protein [Aerococcus sanguinicola]|uniref:ABC transporter ATP-binding protein n=1 Tax=unclassified Aerococcus TaxID=2618060 RepID=UPI0008A60ACA|nr:MULTISPECIES: ABC transporter ATP-binding protein [unclassified Aerococcus]KAB0647907.1 ABC transporter ATP-binding protein [Aerococcus sanguinicola]MDK6855617.1 ABC transporter ATP-binding protein [Aerococcus sp. UMB7533]MDK8502336.1 ABC transporter ATP-binding protein [Aerococcus sp. UMB1112A]OFN02260.1 hypothetical protein HMPREF2626_06865 [Aerococcus sp. HMSC062A02]OHO43190.1 hypothetical protein HMPREF2705_08645 [Aerococcus sp. HMSC035B07]
MTQHNDSVLSLKNVSYYRQGRPILKNINFEIRPGQHWALLGLNGSGKSTLIHILSGYDWPSAGQVTVLGERFGQTNISRLKRRIGLVSSWLEYRLPENDSVLKIVLSGLFASFGLYQAVGPKEKLAAQELLARFDCQDLADRPFATLSQGEKQKILILRGLMTKPELLILDEPFNALDLFARERLLEFLGEVSQEEGLSLVMISHRSEDISQLFQHVLLLKEGQVFAQGSRQDMLQDELLTDFYGQAVDCLPYKDQRVLVVPR